jgi:hypothetical protein
MRYENGEERAMVLDVPGGTNLLLTPEIARNERLSGECDRNMMCVPFTLGNARKFEKNIS